MKKKLVGMVMLLLLCGGCIYTLEGNGEIGFKQTTSWAFYQGTKIDDEGEQKATATLRGSAFDWIMDIFTPAVEEEVGEGDGS